MAKQQIAEERGVADSGWIIVASQFPATLNKLVAPEVLRDGQTPEAWGMGTEKPGYLYAGSLQTGYVPHPFYTSVTAPSDPPEASLTWYWWFNRLWAISGDGLEVYYGANGYKSAYIPQARTLAGYGATTGSVIRAIAPFGPNMALFYDNYVDVIGNADDAGARFKRVELIRTQGAAAASRAVAAGTRLYYINANGVWSVSEYAAQDVTMPVRNSLAPFTTATSTILRYDERRGMVVGLTAGGVVTFGIDVSGEQPVLLDYSTTGFRWTSPTLMSQAGSPLAVDKIAVSYECDDDTKKSIGVEVKINNTWHSDGTRNFVPTGDRGRQEFPLNTVYNCRRWAVRFTSLSSGLYINNVQAKIKQGGVIGYSN